MKVILPEEVIRAAPPRPVVELLPMLESVTDVPDKVRLFNVVVVPIAPVTIIAPAFVTFKFCVAASAPLIAALNVTELADGLIVEDPVSWTLPVKVNAELVVILPPIWINVGGPANVRMLAKMAPVVAAVPVDVRETVANTLSAAPMAHTLAEADPELTFSTAPFELLRNVPFENVMALFAAVKLDVAPALTLILLPTPEL